MGHATIDCAVVTGKDRFLWMRHQQDCPWSEHVATVQVLDDVTAYPIQHDRRICPGDDFDMINIHRILNFYHQLG